MKRKIKRGKGVRHKAKLGLPDLKNVKSTVLVSLRSPESQRSYRHSMGTRCPMTRASDLPKASRLPPPSRRVPPTPYATEPGTRCWRSRTSGSPTGPTSTSTTSTCHVRLLPEAGSGGDRRICCIDAFWRPRTRRIRASPEQADDAFQLGPPPARGIRWHFVGRALRPGPRRQHSLVQHLPVGAVDPL